MLNKYKKQNFYKITGYKIDKYCKEARCSAKSGLLLIDYPYSFFKREEDLKTLGEKNSKAKWLRKSILNF